MTQAEVVTRRRWRGILRVLLLLNIAGTILGNLAMLWEVESVLISGPFLSLAGSCTVLAAGVMRHLAGILVGCAQIAICLLFVSLVNILQWDPTEAEHPFHWMATVYVLCFLPSAGVTFLKLPEVGGFGNCEQCGYLLFGLTSPRCPECGRGFDPALLPALARPVEETASPTDS